MLTIITVNYNTSKFIELLLYALEKLTFHDYKVIIADNNSKLADYNSLCEVVNQFPNVRLYRKEKFSLEGALAHGTTLNELYPQIDTEYGVIVDADFVPLEKHWDKILIDKMRAENSDLIGAKPADWYLGRKPKDFPTMFLLLFKTNVVMELGVDFRPFRPRDLKIDKTIRESLASSFRNDISNFDGIISNSMNPFVFVDGVLRDTGWHLRAKFQKSNLSVSLIDSFSTDVYKDDERFYEMRKVDLFYNSGELIASHFGRGAYMGTPVKFKLMKNVANMARRDNFFKRIIRRLLFGVIRRLFLIRRDEKERDGWLLICRKIIDQQINLTVL